jgi:peptidoglycan hydrolase-like protein with peptidoglycan-binding domain
MQGDAEYPASPSHAPTAQAFHDRGSLLDDHAALAAMTYVDLNPVRAGIATGIEDSDYTSVQTRLQALHADRDAWQAIAASVDAAVRDLLPLRPVAGPTGD